MSANQKDHREDPAHDVAEGDDWAAEGGAVDEGPATDPSSADPDETPDTDD